MSLMVTFAGLIVNTEYGVMWLLVAFEAGVGTDRRVGQMLFFFSLIFPGSLSHLGKTPIVLISQEILPMVHKTQAEQ